MLTHEAPPLAEEQRAQLSSLSPQPVTQEGKDEDRELLEGIRGEGGEETGTEAQCRGEEQGAGVLSGGRQGEEEGMVGEDRRAQEGEGNEAGGEEMELEGLRPLGGVKRARPGGGLGLTPMQEVEAGGGEEEEREAKR